MIRKFCRLLLIACLGLTIISLCPAILNAHDLPGNHLHIKGKITTSDGQPVQGAILQFTRDGKGFLIDCITGMPAGINATFDLVPSGTMSTPPGTWTYTTTATGDFEFIVRILNIPNVVVDIDKLGIDKAKLLAHLMKDGFFFRIR